MASQERMPYAGAEFEPHRQYDHVRIAEEVLWPLVNIIAERDWRKSAASQDENKTVSFEQSVRGNRSGQELEVILSARKYDYEAEEGEAIEGHSIFAVAFEVVKPIENEFQKAVIMQQVVHDNPSLIGAQPLIKTGTIYSIDSDGDAFIDTYQLVEDREGKELWRREPLSVENSSVADASGGILQEPIIPARIGDIDMEIVNNGLDLLNLPPRIRMAMKDICDNPLTA